MKKIITLVALVILMFTSAYAFNEESAHARHILVKTEKQAKVIIEDMKDLHGYSLKSKFIELAKAHSKGPSGSKGGDLGFFKKGNMPAEFSEAAFDLEIGTITKSPVKTNFGYHVIYLEDKK